jgi:hypothetical protein|tara:strand:+ start:580 stop:900 length:321 start_codon:yes stop_codon:yes gene_type:complete
MIVKSSAARQKEHVESTQFYIPFDGTEETCPWKVGDVYDTRPIIAIGFSENVYGHYYHLIVERDRTHLRTKFQFDSAHDLKFSKPVERMTAAPTEAELKKYLPDGL